MDPTTTNRVFFAKNLTLGQLLTSRLIWWGVTGGLILAIMYSFPEWFTHPPASEASEEKVNAVSVRTDVLVEKSDFKIPIWYTGEVVASRKTDLGFQRSGKVIAIHIDEGDYVEKNQPIASLDNRQLSARIKQLGADVLVATANRDELDNGPRIEAIKSAEANSKDIEQQLENAQLDLDRAEELYPRGAVSQQEFDQARYRVKTLKSRFKASEAQLEQLTEGTRYEKKQAAEARLTAAIAASELAEHDLDDCTLKAPFSGTITRRIIDEGTVVDAGQPVVNLVENQQLEFKVGLPVELVRTLKPMQKFSVRIDGVNVERFSLDRFNQNRLKANDESENLERPKSSLPKRIEVEAILRSKIPGLDPKTRTQTVIMKLESPAADLGIVDGQTGRIKFEERTEAPGFVLPITAIVDAQGGLWSCFTVETVDGQTVAKRHSIEIIHFQGDSVFVRGTISNGQTFVTEGLQKLTNNMAVEIVATRSQGGQ